MKDSRRLPRRDVQAAGCLDAARVAAGPKRGVFREAGAERRRSSCQPGGGGGGPGAGRPEREAAQRTAGPGEKPVSDAGRRLFLVESLDDVPLCCCAEADRGGEHVGAVSAAVLPADGDAAVLHSHQGGREDPLCGRIRPDV